MNGNGKYVTTTITSITTIAIDSDGNIDKSSISRGVYINTAISDNMGSIQYENNIVNDIMEFKDIISSLQTAVTNAAAEKGKLGRSPLQENADNINLGINAGVGVIVAVATGGSSQGVQLVAGAAAGVTADKLFPKVTAEQVTKELYYKKEVLK